MKNKYAVLAACIAALSVLALSQTTTGRSLSEREMRETRGLCWCKDATEEHPCPTGNACLICLNTSSAGQCAAQGPKDAYDNPLGKYYKCHYNDDYETKCNVDAGTWVICGHKYNCASNGAPLHYWRCLTDTLCLWTGSANDYCLLCGAGTLYEDPPGTTHPLIFKDDTCR